MIAFTPGIENSPSRARRTLVIFCCLLLAATANACQFINGHQGKKSERGAKRSRQAIVPAGATPAPKAEDYGPPVRVAELEDASIRESSGIVASRLHEGLFWTHNDSGDGPFLYLFDLRGRSRGVWKVEGAKADDWEDIAAGPGPLPGRTYLYVGDIGDNDRERSQIVVYRVLEPPDVGDDAGTSTKQNPRRTETAEAIRLRYPDGAHDAEALLVHPRSGDIYVLTKTPGGSSGVYKLAAPFDSSAVRTLVRVGEINLPVIFGSIITGGDISPDGSAVILCDYFRGYEIRSPDGAASSAFDRIWAQPLSRVDLGERRQGEAVCYGADGRSLFALSEGRHAPIIEVEKLKR
ncbi:MAG TPA: hypothetical protein VM934_10685 [Pyrinomonadaceae bacterium]|nr:hypothetical protein [Pyrinomonadaceae bacterium]